MSLFDPMSSANFEKRICCQARSSCAAFALPDEAAHLDALIHVTASAPFRHMVTPGGFRMSVAMTNCGSLGWITDRTGYRYDAVDPDSGQTWPDMPASFLTLAKTAAAEAGFRGFLPDACLINRYENRSQAFVTSRTGTSATSVRRSFLSPSAFLRYSSLAD